MWDKFTQVKVWLPFGFFYFSKSELGSFECWSFVSLYIILLKNLKLWERDQKCIPSFCVNPGWIDILWGGSAMDIGVVLGRFTFCWSRVGESMSIQGRWQLTFVSIQDGFTFCQSGPDRHLERFHILSINGGAGWELCSPSISVRSMGLQLVTCLYLLAT